MIQTISLTPGVTLRVCRDTRFKQNCMSFQFVRPMCEEEVALNALLPDVLLRGTRRHPSLQAISRYADSLYGPSLMALVRRAGDYQTTGLSFGIMDDRFALPGDKILAPIVELLGELLLDPLLENGAFVPSIVEGEKKNLITTIESQLDNKQAYAMNALFKLLCREDSYRIPRLGEKAQVEAITPQDLYAHYRRVLRESPIEIFYVGSAEAETIANLLMPILEKMDRQVLPLPPQGGYVPCPGAEVSEAMDITQGKLCMGFTTPITNRDVEFPAMMALNFIFGGGMTSKLFMTIREKMSLCYSIGSQYFAAKGLLLVHAGIDFDKEEVTKQEVFRLLDKCRQGHITPEELEAARESILSALNTIFDTPGSIESYFSSDALNPLVLNLEQYREAVKNLTLAQVVAAANTVSYHSTFFLKGVSQ